MQDSPWLDPRFLFIVGTALIGAIAWLIRLESKVNGIDKSQQKMEQSVDEGWNALDQHRNNENVHFNQRLAAEVERRQSERMDRMQSDIQEIKTLVKGMAGK